MRRSRLLLAGLCTAVVLSTTPNVMGFDVEPIVKFFFEQRPVPTVLNLSNLPDCCLVDYQAEIEATLALVLDTSCKADDRLEGSQGDLLFTPFQDEDLGARPKNDGRTLVRFKNQGTFTLGVTTFRVFNETQICGGNPFFKTADADVDLNLKVNWVKDPGAPFCTGPDPSTNHFSLTSVALHELGHVIGLEHTDDDKALMFAFGEPCDFKMDTFQTDDQAQFDFIYACEDKQCQTAPPEPPELTDEKGKKKCTDEIDNDGDGDIDCADLDCASRGFCKTGELVSGM